MKQTLLIITALMLVVGCSEPINIDELVERDGIWHSKDTNKPYSGKAVKYLENGQKELEGNYKDGKKEGIETEWYENGQKKSEGTYKNGKDDGLYTKWYENGQKKSELNYKDGKQDGLWNFWFENGQKGYEGTYKNGEEISVKEWNEDGSVKE